MVVLAQTKNVILILILAVGNLSVVHSFIAGNYCSALYQTRPLRKKLPSTCVVTVVKSVSEEDEEIEGRSQPSVTDSLPENGAFDAGGLANYLGPYFLALLASIAVTAVFFNFLLMDN
mmetsp:Transcript_30730/g.29604  ORF Transcript_30730/g.29604 Transcript_30730/m.29604 type:complete len:118 (-) Transcript_30730:98-451(-)|eukprot:CAMPEP_0197832758 /NCGR_PEP_ID=MMETSP1437-20131217/16060_1 /TAXON_ID=49252 ORGANISM="Eucampia antarctica, Strain CCMP1452" /NCGR_SAMPLE_ID=MMETSP1437 /ASSEMBLY_ACC=CAM_ASM_001096 /LENGTH=117 /DNA_ID=CAMNT_0043436327 /DNA_START=37 /DNA_END=390 /DNA_ORIENTATION=+